jgi:cyclopropane fatty-acyl-phospholipid synthase-like methyltransferase
MSDYIKVIYDDKRRPYTDYPRELADYLFRNYSMKSGQSLLEPGCGRGEILRCFKDMGMSVRGTDLSPEATIMLSDIDIKICDVENHGLPYPDNTFDVIYSKSFLEHFYYPERYIKEAYRTLKPGGLLLTMVPDWEVNYRKYFDDYTHRTPFTSISLKDIQLIHGFISVEVVKFRQLPILWKFPSLNIFCDLIAPFIPVRTAGKMRWVRELMLIGVGRKPQLSQPKL